LPEASCVALAFFAVRLTDRCSRCAGRADGLRARPNGSGAARIAAIAVWRSWRAAAGRSATAAWPGRTG